MGFNLPERCEERLLKRFQRYVEIVAVSGHEDAMIREIVEELRTAFDGVEVDSLGNVSVAVAGADAFHVVLVAHMDEVGFVVKGIDADGYVRIQQITGFIERTLVGQSVCIGGRHGLVAGVVGTRSDHILRAHERFSVPPVPEVYVDVGAASDRAAYGLGIAVGSPVACRSGFSWLTGGRFQSRAIDDRMGVAVMMELAALIREQVVRPACSLTLAFSVQEEAGMRGARALSPRLRGHVVLAVDSSVATDMPDGEIGDGRLEVGGGVAIKVADSQRTSIEGLIVNPKLVDALEQTALRAGVPYQKEVVSGLTTDSTLMQYRGMVAGGIGVPVRNGHSANEVGSWDDVRACLAFVIQMVEDAPAYDLRRYVESEGS